MGRLLTEVYKNISKTQRVTHAKCFYFVDFQSSAKSYIRLLFQCIFSLLYRTPAEKKEQSVKYFQNTIDKENKGKGRVVTTTIRKSG